MPFILQLATVLTAALTLKTLEGTKKVVQKRNRRRQKDGN